MSLQPGHYSSLTAPNLQTTANQERYDQCGNQHHYTSSTQVLTDKSEDGDIDLKREVY